MTSMNKIAKFTLMSYIVGTLFFNPIAKADGGNVCVPLSIQKQGWFKRYVQGVHDINYSMKLLRNKKAKKALEKIRSINVPDSLDYGEENKEDLKKARSIVEYTIALCFEAMGEPDSAIYHCKRSVQANGGLSDISGNSYLLIAKGYEKMGDYDSAILYADSALESFRKGYEKGIPQAQKFKEKILKKKK